MKHQTLPLTALLFAACLCPAAEPAGSATAALGAWTATVTIPQAPVPGKALDVDVTLSPASPAPKAARLWVGKADGRGSVKAKAEPEAPGTYCVGVELPDPIPAGAQVWISLEGADGATVKAAVPLPPAR